MNIKKSIAYVAVFVLLACGYFAGAILGYPLMGNNMMLRGDISKVKAYKQTENPEVLAIMEQIANDTAVQKQVAASAVVLGARIYELDEILATVNTDDLEATDEKSQEVLKDWKALSKRAKNAREAYDTYVEELTKVMNGEKSENFEQAANNAYLAYNVMDRNLDNIAPEIVDRTIEGSALSLRAPEVLNGVIELTNFCAEQDVLNGAQIMTASWEDKMVALEILGDIPERRIVAYSELSKIAVIDKVIKVALAKIDDIPSAQALISLKIPVEEIVRCNKMIILNQEKLSGYKAINCTEMFLGLAFPTVLGKIDPTDYERHEIE